ncbi:hypothetical protein HYPSUDRAFT_206092 [Hypholoma sublateritium FD-334 SS-4]|uniref:Uncharacterized protein n=1 Tax=Hypholoma sublateritium (strain FD-334 SS-4) TaxID=945553 RepID=A0A0D2NF64_HYPSF|nr:hypothetical protein HYPSUDRAFT_206092 [Hypholoma sublateritium FD-334 SS-4]
MESIGSRTSWSSADVDWARRGLITEEAHRALQQQNDELFKENNVWRAKFETLQAAYNLLLERVPAPPEAQRQKLDPNDYKFIDYWFRHQWVASSGDRVTDITGKAENEDKDTEDFGEDLQSIFDPSPAGAQRGQGRSRAGINVSMRFIQNSLGQIIDGHRAREIRIHARALFVSFALQGKQFISWGDADALSRKTFYNEMVSRFEELQYCDLDWKSEQIAIDTYPEWDKAGSPTLSPPLPEASTSQVPIPVINVIPNTPIRLQALPEIANFDMQGLEQHQLRGLSLLRSTNVHHDFSIANPLTNGVNTLPSTGMLPPTTNPATGLLPRQAPEISNIQPTLGSSSNIARPFSADNNPLAPTPPVRQPRTGATKMRPSKSSITPRNLCALDWTNTNPKGTTDQFSAYYDSLSAEEKEKWAKLSADAKAAGKPAS